MITKPPPTRPHLAGGAASLLQAAPLLDQRLEPVLPQALLVLECQLGQLGAALLAQEALVGARRQAGGVDAQTQAGVD